MGYDKCSVGRLMSTKLEHSRSNSNNTNQLILAKLEHSIQIVTKQADFGRSCDLGVHM
jgi:hypothetical protein